jgi:hypothetical protein
MIYGERPAVFSPQTSFSEVVDEACDRLMDQQAKYSIQRIAEMENRLTVLERELDAFLLQKNGK